MLGRDVGVVERAGLVPGGLHELQGGAGQLRLADVAARSARQRGQGAVDAADDEGLVGADGGEQVPGDAVVLAQQGGEDVQRFDLGVTGRGGATDRIGQRLLGAGGELEVHGLPPDGVD